MNLILDQTSRLHTTVNSSISGKLSKAPQSLLIELLILDTNCTYNSQLKIYLLTHEREIARASNTGSIAIENSHGVVERIIWQRKSPDEKLTKLIDANRIVLLYPTDEPSVATIQDFENILVIDATWQESRKIVSKSLYLNNVPHTTLKNGEVSEYKLRRNQQSGGLCTIECVVEVLKIKGQDKLASSLEVDFLKFNER